ncbi:uncharacterized protein LOC111135722 [Crassostrea virginica]
MDAKVFFISFSICALSLAENDPESCRRLNNPRLIPYCYQEQVYLTCAQTCAGLILADDKYVRAECPWGNNDNVIANNLDSFCREAITPAICHDTCINPVTMVPKRVLGWKCCKTCVDVCGEAPSRDPNFEIRYPGVYS